MNKKSLMISCTGHAFRVVPLIILGVMFYDPDFFPGSVKLTLLLLCLLLLIMAASILEQGNDQQEFSCYVPGVSSCCCDV